jgi:hypothetical protein
MKSEKKKRKGLGHRRQNFEVQYWKAIVKALEPEKMERYYDDLQKRLKEKGLWLPPTEQ